MEVVDEEQGFIRDGRVQFPSSGLRQNASQGRGQIGGLGQDGCVRRMSVCARMAVCGGRLG